MIKKDISTPQAVILTNTRELAMQISDVMIKLGKQVPAAKNRVLLLIGGNPLNEDIDRIKNYRPAVIISTPVKLSHFVQDGYINLSNTSILAVDEAD